MYNYYTTIYNGRTIHVVEAKSDDDQSVKLSLMSWKYDNANARVLLSQFYDSYEESNLEGQGYTKVAAINGGIFNDQYAPIIYANGLEKSFWVDHEMTDDSDLNGVMAVAHTELDDSIVIDTQNNIRNNGGSYRGCVTSAFGLLKNGSVVHGDILQGSYSSLSGRSIIGKKSDGTIIFAATPGTTGSSGLTGDQVTGLAQALGLYDAVCLDGGGSVSLIYQGSWKVSTSRLIKNAFGLYVKQKDTGTGGGGETTPVNSRKRNGFIPFFDKKVKWLHLTDDELVPVKDVKIMTANGLVSILDDEVKGD